MYRPFTNLQSQMRSSAFKASHSTPPEQQSFGKASKLKNTQIQKNYAYDQPIISQDLNKQSIKESNQQISEALLFGQTQTFNQSKFASNEQPSQMNPLFQTSQDFFKAGLSDLREDIYKKSNKIKQTLINKATRNEARSISPFSKTASKTITATAAHENYQPISSPHLHLEKEQEIREILAKKLQELEILKKQTKDKANQVIQNNKEQKQLQNEREELENLKNKHQNNTTTFQFQPSNLNCQTNYNPTCKPQSSNQNLSSQKAQQRESTQNTQLRKRIKLLQQYESSKKEQRSNRSLETDSKSQNIESANVQNEKLILTEKKQLQKQQPSHVQQFENLMLKKQLNDLQEQRNKDQKEIFALKDALLKEKQLVTTLKTDNSILKQAKNHLQDQLDQQKYEEMSSALNQTPNKKLQEEKRKIENFKGIMEQQSNQTIELQKDNEKLQSEIKKMQQSTIKLKQDNQSMLNKIAHYQIQNGELQIQSDQQKEICLKAQEEQAKLQMELQTLVKQWKTEQKGLIQQISILQEENQKLIAISTDLQKEIDYLVNQMQDKVVEIIKQTESNFENQLLMISSRLQEKEQYLDKINLLVKQKLQSDLQSLLELQEQITVDEQNQSQISLSNQKLYNYEQEIQSLLKTKNDLEYMLQQNQEYHDIKVEELEYDIQAISEEKNQLIIELQEMKENNNLLITQIDQLEQELLQKDVQIGQMYGEGKFGQKYKKSQNILNQDLEEENDILQSQKKELQKELNQLQLQATDQLQDLQLKLEEITELYNNLFFEVSSATFQLPETQQMV